jgi:hypothetical protein
LAAALVTSTHQDGISQSAQAPRDFESDASVRTRDQRDSICRTVHVENVVFSFHQVSMLAEKIAVEFTTKMIDD